MIGYRFIFIFLFPFIACCGDESNGGGADRPESHILLIKGETFSGYKPYFKLGQVTTSEKKKCTKYHWSLGYRVEKHRSQKIEVTFNGNEFLARAEIKKEPHGSCGWIAKTLSIGLNNVVYLSREQNESVVHLNMKCNYLGGNSHPSNQYRCAQSKGGAMREINFLTSELNINFSLN